MKKVNFHTFENLTVSDELMQKALSIPENAKATPIPFYRRTRSLAAAASFVLVFALSLFLIFFFENKNVVPIAPFSTQKPAVADTREELSTESASESRTPASQETDAPATQPQTQVSTDSEGNTIITVITEITTIEQSPAEDGHAEPDEQEGEDNGSGDSPSGNTPTEQATSPPDVKPVYLYQLMSDFEVEPIEEILFQLEFQTEHLTDEDQLYCRIYDAEGNLWGNPDFYAVDHKASLKLTDNTVSVKYYSDITYGELWRCDHTFEFYDEYGRVLCVYKLLSQ